MKPLGDALWEYHIKEKKKRAIPLRPSLEIETGIVIDRLLVVNAYPR